MISWDTNFLIRYLITQDAPEQTQAVLKNLESQQRKGRPVFLASIALCETVWVLRSAYGLPRQAIATILRHLLDDTNFLFENPEQANKALGMYSAQKGDFADYLIALTARDAVHAEKTHTFDKGLKANKLFQVH